MSNAVIFFGDWRDLVLLIDFIFTGFSFVMIWVLIRKLECADKTGVKS